MSDQEHNNETDKPDLNDPLLREKEEPRENSSPMPVFILFVFAAFCFWGGIYLVEHDGGFSKNAYTLDYDPAAKIAVVQVILFDRGKKVYNAQCIACHQINGQGITGVYPPLAGSEWVLGHQEVLARILVNGMNGPIEVLGNQYNGNMPAFGPGGLNLKPLDIASVLTYIRQEWGSAGSDFTEETMKKYMDMYSARTTPWNAEEIVLDLGPEPEPPVEEPSGEVLDSGEMPTEAAGSDAP
jgi:mono/diheme cytochrome c family protein